MGIKRDTLSKEGFCQFSFSIATETLNEPVSVAMRKSFVFLTEMNDLDIRVGMDPDKTRLN